MGNQQQSISKNYKFINMPQSTTKRTLLPIFNQPIYNNPKNPIPSKYKYDTIKLDSGNVVIPQNYKNQQDKTIRIVTYNVWFQSQNIKNRIPNILKLLKDSDAQFICLQEVTHQFMEQLNKSNLFKQYYSGKYNMYWYDALILSKYKCVNYKIPFSNSNMCRSLIISQLQIQNCSILIATTHLENLNADIRQQQLKQSFNYLRWGAKSILAGDLNFGDGCQQNRIIIKQYTDLFIFHLKESCKGLTVFKSPKNDDSRSDHILAKGFNLQNSYFETFGDFTVSPFQDQKITDIEEDGIVRTPSDHLGLFCEIPLYD